MNTFKQIYYKLINARHNYVNKKNRKRLVNLNPTLICSNCAGGILYHWLGLKFNSPFINLFMTNEDFLTALENFEEFINGEIKEYRTEQFSYPLGIGVHGEIIHFMHYPSFDDAMKKWEERKRRINYDNICFMLTNLGCGLDKACNQFNDYSRGGELSIIQRFNKLKVSHKIIFSGVKYNEQNVVYLKGYNKVKEYKNIWANKSIWGLRYLDQFDYVSYFNNINKTCIH